MGLLKRDFFVASSDHAAAVEGHAHQGMLCLCGLGGKLRAVEENLHQHLRCLFFNAFFICMCILKIKKENKNPK